MTTYSRLIEVGNLSVIKIFFHGFVVLKQPRSPKNAYKSGDWCLKCKEKIASEDVSEQDGLLDSTGMVIINVITAETTLLDQTGMR